MKYLILASLALSFVATNARAERCSVEGHTDELINAYENAVKKNLANLPKKAGFAMNPDTLVLKTQYDQISDDEYISNTELQMSGSFQSDKGTDFDIIVHSAGIWIKLNGESVELSTREGEVAFTTTLLSKGHDREGNPIEPRCRLVTSAWFNVQNKKNGRVITRFELPSTITINTKDLK